MINGEIFLRILNIFEIHIEIFILILEICIIYYGSEKILFIP